ncbi:MAG: hypothetical protein V7670_03035 [Maribacter arcticus]|uniref:hypothetical protein n=1 Tax=Maribacter arcticus TaxID=561365 RepID=UPI003001A519
MSEDANIRLNKVLRELKMPMLTACKTLEEHGHVIPYIPTAIIAVEQYQILKDAKPTISASKKAKKPDKKVVRKTKPELQDLLFKIEKICVGQPLRKIAVVFDIPDEVILKLGSSSIPNCNLRHRVNKENFDSLKPILSVYVEKFLESLPEEKSDKRKKKKKKKNRKSSPYTETSKYNDFVRIIYTNM